MQTKTLFITVLILSFLCSSVFSKPSKFVEVKDTAELNVALSKASPGETIVMGDGSWTNVRIRLTKSGTSSSPITLKAKTPGEVILTGSSSLIFEADYNIVDGLVFKGGSLKNGSIVTFKSNNCRLSNTVIADYNPQEFKTSYYWVLFNGNHNRTDHCLFQNKTHKQTVIGNDFGKYNHIDSCYFKDMPYNPENGREMIRLVGYGNSEQLGDNGAFAVVEYNLFENADGEGAEVISVKSNRNNIRYNTILETRGGITLRAGNFNTVEGNYTIGKNKRGSTGIRVAGQGHTVINNYVADVAGDGLAFCTGEYIDTFLTSSFEPLSRRGTPLGRVPHYGHVKNGTFSNNIFYNIGGNGIQMAWSYKSGWPQQQRILLAENNIITNNIIKTTGGDIINCPKQDINPPLDIFKFIPNKFDGTIAFGGPVNMEPTPNGIIIKDPMLQTDENGIYRTTSIKIPSRPLSSKDVGPKWMKK